VLEVVVLVQPVVRVCTQGLSAAPSTAWVKAARSPERSRRIRRRLALTTRARPIPRHHLHHLRMRLIQRRVIQLQQPTRRSDTACHFRLQRFTVRRLATQQTRIGVVRGSGRTASVLLYTVCAATKIEWSPKRHIKPSACPPVCRPYANRVNLTLKSRAIYPLASS
jgi:hypothetical protein